jgi:hypothetical protein
MTLTSAARHLRRRHWDCDSCHLESMVMQKMAAGEGFISRGRDIFAQLTSKGLDR